MNSRQPDFPIDPLFLERWSPRAFDMSDMPIEDLQSIFEAARWAPSAFNSQPWHFCYARRGDADWARFLDLLIPWNQSWAQSASVLIYILSNSFMLTKSGEQESHTHSYDAGAAWACMALQATRMGYHAHGMSGVDFDRVRTELKVPDTFRVEAACVIGRRGDPAILEERQRAREFPNDRKPQKTFVHAGNLSVEDRA